MFFGDPESNLQIQFDPRQNPDKEYNGGSKKIMLDSTLIGTLEGFCNIRKGDTE